MDEYKIGDIINTVWGDERSVIISEPTLAGVTFSDGEHTFVDCHVLGPDGRVALWGYETRETIKEH